MWVAAAESKRAAAEAVAEQRCSANCDVECAGEQPALLAVHRLCSTLPTCGTVHRPLSPLALAHTHTRTLPRSLQSAAPPLLRVRGRESVISHPPSLLTHPLPRPRFTYIPGPGPPSTLEPPLLESFPVLTHSLTHTHPTHPPTNSIMKFLALAPLFLSALVSAFTIEGSFAPSPLLPNPASLPPSTSLTLTTSGITKRTLIQRDNKFVFRNVSEGSYLLDVQCQTHHFGPLRIDVDRSGDVKVHMTFRGNEWSNIGEKRNYPIVRIFFSGTPKDYILICPVISYSNPYASPTTTSSAKAVSILLILSSFRTH